MFDLVGGPLRGWTPPGHGGGPDSGLFLVGSSRARRIGSFAGNFNGGEGLRLTR